MGKTTKGVRTNLTIDWLLRREVPEAAAIAKYCFTKPWTEERFRKYIAQRSSIGLVAKDSSGKVVGYLIYRVISDCCRFEIVAVATVPRYRRLGIGWSLVSDLIDKLNPDGQNEIVAEVGETELPTQLFLRELGFKVRQTTKRAKKNFYLFTYRLPLNSYEAD